MAYNKFIFTSCCPLNAFSHNPNCYTVLSSKLEQPPDASCLMLASVHLLKSEKKKCLFNKFVGFSFFSGTNLKLKFDLYLIVTTSLLSSFFFHPFKKPSLYLNVPIQRSMLFCRNNLGIVFAASMLVEFLAQIQWVC